MKVKSESEVAQSCPTLVTPWTAVYQAPLSMGFSRQEYWSGVPSPSVNKAKVEIFLELSCFFDDPMDVGNLLSAPLTFLNQLAHLEVHGSRTAEAWLGEF